MKRLGINWKKLERGQALMEYWPTFPAAVGIMIGAGAITAFLGGAFSSTTEGLNRAGLPQEVCETTEETTEGPTVAQLGDHTVEVTAQNYDPETDTTTVTYTVTSGTQPSISHWVLAMPSDVADNIVDVSEQYEWTDSDPTTGVAGIKFDTGYEGGEAGGSSSEESGGGKGKGKGKGSASLFDLDNQYVSSGWDMTSDIGYVPGVDPIAQEGEETTITMPSTGEAREITMVLSGMYQFETTTVTVKAGTETEYAEISAPTQVVDTSSTEADPTDADSYYTGCD